jgi:hypothetical protein
VSASGPDLGKPLATDRSTMLLPCAPDQFGDFVAGLLGKPQTIERSIKGPFVVTKDDIENLHHLIEQRVSSQNERTLIQFTCRIVYDDDSSVLLNSFPDFNEAIDFMLSSSKLDISDTISEQDSS